MLVHMLHMEGKLKAFWRTYCSQITVGKCWQPNLWLACPFLYVGNASKTGFKRTLEKKQIYGMLRDPAFCHHRKTVAWNPSPLQKKQFLQWEIQNCYKQSSRDRGFQLSVLRGKKMLKMLVWHQFHWEVLRSSNFLLIQFQIFSRGQPWGSASRLWFCNSESSWMCGYGPKLVIWTEKGFPISDPRNFTVLKVFCNCTISHGESCSSNTGRIVGDNCAPH